MATTAQWRKVKAHVVSVLCAASVFILPGTIGAQQPGAVAGQQTPGQPPARQTITLDQAVEEALRNNLDLLAERQNVPVARAREIQAALRPNPALLLTWNYQNWLGTGVNTTNNAGPPEFNSQFNYIWETAGKRGKRIELAQLITSVTELRLLDSMRQLTLGVRQACVDYLLAQTNLELARQNLSVFENILKINDAKVKAGDLAGVELIRTRVALQQVQNAVQQAELKLQTASNNLQQLLGRRSPGAPLDLMGKLNEELITLDLPRLRDQALSQRPDLLALRKDVQRGNADARLQKAIGRPDITTGVLYNNQYGYASGQTLGLYASSDLPIFNRNQGEVARAQRETRQVEMRSTALEAAISTEVQNAWQQYMTARSLMERIRGSLLPEAQQVREITQFSYLRGEASLLEFLDAQRAYNDAMQSFNDARADYTRSLYLIDAVIGKAVQP